MLIDLGLFFMHFNYLYHSWRISLLCDRCLPSHTKYYEMKHIINLIFPKIKLSLTMKGKLIVITGTWLSVTHCLLTLTARFFWGLLRTYNKGHLGNSSALWPHPDHSWYHSCLWLHRLWKLLHSSSAALGWGLSAQDPAARGGPSLMLFWGSVPSLSL